MLLYVKMVSHVNEAEDVAPSGGTPGSSAKKSAKPPTTPVKETQPINLDDTDSEEYEEG